MNDANRFDLICHLQNSMVDPLPFRQNIVHVLSTIDTLASRSALAEIAVNDSDPAIRKLETSYLPTTRLPMD